MTQPLNSGTRSLVSQPNVLAQAEARALVYHWEMRLTLGSAMNRSRLDLPFGERLRSVSGTTSALSVAAGA